MYLSMVIELYEKVVIQLIPLGGIAYVRNRGGVECFF